MFKSIACLLMLISAITVAQEETGKHLLDTDWGKEIFTIPTGFAQEMTLNGFEDASFAPGWSDVKSDEFWTYVFAWSVENDTMISMEEIEQNLLLYFNGLVSAKPDTIVNGRLPTSVLLIDTSDGSSARLTGKVRLFDSFKTQKMLTLNLLVEQQYCDRQKRAILVFRFSPKALNHQIWSPLTAIPLFEDACDRG